MADQLELNFDEKPKKKEVDYELIYEALKKGPLTYHEIEILSGVSHGSVPQVLATLTIKYPVYDSSRGVYELLK